MPANQGTKVIAKIVTPDSGDTFATHDANTGEGGLHNVATHQQMITITTERRKEGMECSVSSDPDPSKNGKYTLQNDLQTWLKQIDGGVLGAPPDSGWGNGNSSTHLLSGVSTGDTREQYVDKILALLDSIAPPPPPGLENFVIVLPSTWNANQQGEAVHTPVNNIQANIQPTGTLSGKFGNAVSGTVKALVDGVLQGSLTLTPQPAGNDNGVNGALTLSGEEVYNNLYQQILATVRATNPLFLNNVPHTYRLEHDTAFTETTFFIDDPVQPSLTGITLAGVYAAGVGFISGVPTLKAGDSLKTGFTVVNAISWYYNLIRVARVESNYTNTIDPPTPVNLNRGNNVPFSNIIVSVLNNVYTENAQITIRCYNSRALTLQEILADTSSQLVAGTSGNIRIDTVSDESITVSSGEGQFPSIGLGPLEAGAPFNSTEDLNTTGNEELMMLNGIIQYPSGNFTANTPNAGPNYNAVPAGSHNGLRWRTFDLGSITDQNAVLFNIIGAVNFNGAPIESGIELYLVVDGGTGWLNANVSYPGSGNPVNNGDPALDAGASSATVKRVTFGTQPRSGRVLVRIGIPAGSTKTFKRIQ